MVERRGLIGLAASLLLGCSTPSDGAEDAIDETDAVPGSGGSSAADPDDPSPGSTNPGTTTSDDPTGGPSSPSTTNADGSTSGSSPPADCGTDLAAQFDVATLTLDVQGQQDQSVPTIVAPGLDGDLWVAWTDSPWSEGHLFAHIRHVDADLTISDEGLDIPDSIVLGLRVLDDGDLAVAHGRRTGPESSDPNWGGSPSAPAANTLFLSRFSGPDELFRTAIRGGEGYENAPESTWFLTDGTGAAVSVAYDGTDFGLFFMIGRHFRDGGVHQADEFVMVGGDGTVHETSRNTWINSHSFWPSALSAGGSMYTLTVADPFPVWGVRLGTLDGGTFSQSTVWPTPDLAGQVPEGGVVARVGALFEVEGRLAAAVRTAVDPANPAGGVSGPQRALLLTMNPDGSDAVASPIDDTLLVDVENDLVVAASRFGADALTLTGVGPNASVFGHAPVVARVLAPDGTPLTEGVELDARLAWSSDPVTLSDGSAAWAAIEDNVSTTLQIARIGCE